MRLFAQQECLDRCWHFRAITSGSYRSEAFSHPAPGMHQGTGSLSITAWWLGWNGAVLGVSAAAAPPTMTSERAKIRTAIFIISYPLWKSFGSVDPPYIIGMIDQNLAQVQLFLIDAQVVKMTVTNVMCYEGNGRLVIGFENLKSEGRGLGRVLK